MKDWLVLLRPKQWSKNLLVFAALLFTHGFDRPSDVAKTLIAFAAMCLISSAIYIFNDLKDLERDRNHPRKKLRPIASGSISPSAATVVGLLLLAAGIAAGASLAKSVLSLILIYLALQVVYNFGLKKIPVTDVFILSLGFVLRAALGAAAIDVVISGWLLFCTGALALLLGFGKRRHEWQLQGESRSQSRESLAGYNRASLDALVLMSAVGAALCYGVYAVESPTARLYPALILTSLFVFYGIFRYVYLIFSQEEGGEPETLLLSDPHLLFSVIGFIVTAVLAMKGMQVPLLEGSK